MYIYDTLHKDLRKFMTLHKDLCTFMIPSRALLLRVRNVLDRTVEKTTKHISCAIIFYPTIMPYMG